MSEYDYVFEPVKRVLSGNTNTNCREPLKTPESRLVVAPESDWQAFENSVRFTCPECEMSLEQTITADVNVNCASCKYRYPIPKILIEAETLFSGDDGPIFDSDGNGPLSLMGPDDDVLGDYKLTHIIERTFKTLEGTQAEITWWLGDSFEWFLPWWPAVNHDNPQEFDWESGIKVLHSGGLKVMPNWIVGTTEANESKLKSIEHLCNGVYVR